jgi:hypothetical protein
MHALPEQVDHFLAVSMHDLSRNCSSPVPESVHRLLGLERLLQLVLWLGFQVPVRRSLVVLQGLPEVEWLLVQCFEGVLKKLKHFRYSLKLEAPSGRCE